MSGAPLSARKTVYFFVTKSHKARQTRSFQQSRAPFSHCFVHSATGHGNFAYWTLVKAEDQQRLAELTRKKLDEYIKEAPTSQQGIPPPMFRKYARKSNTSDPVSTFSLRLIASDSRSGSDCGELY